MSICFRPGRLRSASHPPRVKQALAASFKTRPLPNDGIGWTTAVKVNRTKVAGRRSGFRIAGAEQLTKGIGFAPYAFRERLVFHGVFARGLKFSPQAMDDGQTLAAIRHRRTVSQVGSVRRNYQVEQ